MSVGIGFRWEIAEKILDLEENQIQFLEFAPENWMGIGGKYRQLLLRAIEKYPIMCHGLSLSMGSPEPMDWEFVEQLKEFFSQIPLHLYSEHLSYCKCQNAHLYDLLPLPFTEEAIFHVASRIREVQDFLERPIAIENVSYYCAIEPQMEEAEFLSRVIEESGCLLLLDVNNVFVNASNHGYDPYDFLRRIPLEKVAYIHMAGHEQISPEFILDSHAHSIVQPVYQLFDWVVQQIQPVPVLLERDSNFADFEGLIAETERLKAIMSQYWTEQKCL